MATAIENANTELSLSVDLDLLRNVLMTENLRPKRIVSYRGNSATIEVFTRFTIACRGMSDSMDGLFRLKCLPNYADTLQYDF